MSNLKFVVLSGTLLKIVYCVCVTAAAIHFNDSSILWWYFLSCTLGYSYSSDGKKEANHE